MELLLCDKMLKADERNFHCWNYRLWVIQVYSEEMGKRLENRYDKEVSDDAKVQLLEKECEMAEALIKKNFANFSAWHYRGKLMPEMFIKIPDTHYKIPLDRIHKDIDMLKHAFYTDPKD